MKTRKLAIVCSLSVLALVTACSSNPPRNDWAGDSPGVVSRSTQYGNVSSIEVLNAASHSIGSGAVIGAVLGAVIGNQVGSGSGRAVATGVGAVGGAVIGHRIENRNASDSDVYRVRVRFDNGTAGQFDYQRIDDLRVGDRVRLEGGQLYRA